MTIDLSVYLAVSLGFCFMNFDSISRFMPVYIFLMDDVVFPLAF